jgi:hypothetical protein
MVVISGPLSEAASRWVIESIGRERLGSEAGKELDFIFDSKDAMKAAIQRVQRLSLNIVTVPIEICEDGSWLALML